MKFNKKVFNISAWLVVILAYVLPAHNRGEFATNFGYPFYYLTIYDIPLNKTLLSSFSLNIGRFFVNIGIIYFIIIGARKIFIKAHYN